MRPGHRREVTYRLTLVESDQLERAFAEALGIGTVRFGRISPSHLGVSDGNSGVQWNMWVDRQPCETGLGVNLEGLKYDG
jgi:hypothetical protein